MERQRARVGCLLGAMALAVGVLLGVGLTAGLLGVGLDLLWARATGQGPALVLATAGPPTPAPQIIGGAAPGRRLVWRGAIALDSDTREPDLLVVSRNYDREPSSDTLLLFSPSAGAVRWESAPMGENGNSWALAYGPSAIFVADESRLRAVSRANGGLLWEAPLSDKLSYNLCLDCLQVFGGAVVALTDDGVIQAFRADSGAPLWSARLNQATRQLVRVGAMVGVPDALEKDDSDAGLRVYNPADGTLVRVIAPSCAQPSGGGEDRPHYYDRILADGQSGALYWMLNSAGCLVRVDPAANDNGRPIYLKRFSDDFSATNQLLAGGTFYLSIDSGHGLESLDAQGNERALLQADDYALQPLESDGAALLVLASRTRGSSRLELWLVDLASGARRWTHPLLGRDVLSGPYDSGDFSAHMLGDAVALIDRSDDPKLCRYDLLDMANGTSRVGVAVAVDDPGASIRGATWGAQRLWLSVDQLYGLRLSDGTVAARWP